jgi:hypothetical protein
MFAIDLDWQVASRYELREVVRSEGETEIAICPAQGATVTLQRPIEQSLGLYIELAGLDGSEQSCLEFAHKYGLLINSDAQGLSHWMMCVEDLRHTISICQLGSSNPRQAWKQFGNQEHDLAISFTPVIAMQGPLAPPLFLLRYTSLFDAIEFQAVQSILGGRMPMQCLECSTWFEIGGGGRRRSQAKFCSRRCKDRFHNRLKSFERERTKL